MPEEDINESVTEEDGYVVTTVTTSMTVSLNSPDTSDKYQVQYEDRCGRMLVATKFISAGETIFTDEPACMGPDNNPRPVCLVCCARLVRGYVVTCDNCGWPLCSETCRENLGQHVRECSLFKSTDTKFDLNDMKATCPSYNAIMVLRLLWLQENEPVTWNKIDLLMDHREENLSKITRADERVISFIREFCQLIQYSRSMILRVIGIIDTNAYIIGENKNKNVDIQGLFPTCSIINHSCQANTICFATDNFNFVCRAVVDIKPGDEITTNYLYHQYHFFGNTYRANELQDYWHFRCNCNRCNDPWESGSYVDSIMCDQCEKETLTPGPGPGHYSMVTWSCCHCDNSVDGSTIAIIIDSFWNKLQENVWAELSVHFEILKELRVIVGERHYYTMEVKRRIFDKIGSDNHDYDNISSDLLRIKMKFCDEHLSLAAMLCPGLTEYRAYLSLHYAESLYWALKKGLTLIDNVSIVTRILEHLSVVINIWNKYRMGSAERIKVDQAQNLIEKIRKEYYDILCKS